MYMRLIGTDLTKSPALATLQISPSMTKVEVREYLTKIYGINVLKVDTLNRAGTNYSFEVPVNHLFIDSPVHFVV